MKGIEVLKQMFNSFPIIHMSASHSCFICTLSKASSDPNLIN